MDRSHNSSSTLIKDIDAVDYYKKFHNDDGDNLSDDD